MCRPDEILITVGVSEALDLLFLLMIGDEVIYREPCYVSYSPLSRWPTVWRTGGMSGGGTIQRHRRCHRGNHHG